MRKAVILFQELGWYDVSRHYPTCTAVYQQHDALITFSRSRVNGQPFIEAECDGESLPLTVNEIIAIYAQCKELGWLDEEIHSLV